jgi:Tol biopolymer transport system component
MRVASLAIVVVLALTTSLQAGTSSESTPTGAQPERTPQAKETLDLAAIPFKLVYETYRPTDRRDNWELFMINADGSEPVNLTNTPTVNEMYPHVSPDGTKISFVVDEGKGRKRIRHVYYMNIDGSDRVHVAEHARQPCWCFDSKSIAYLRGEYTRYSTREYATSGLMLYYLEKQWHRPHVNSELHHAYATCWSPDGKWFLAAVQGGMGYSDTIVAFAAFGKEVFDLGRWGVKGCRPEFSPDGTKMFWGETDWNLMTGDIDTTGPEPKVTNITELVRCSRKSKVYHIDPSPDGKYIAFSYGPVRGGQQVGGKARGWNICISDLTGKWVQITTDGLHNKEPDWVPIP